MATEDGNALFLRASALEDRGQHRRAAALYRRGVELGDPSCMANVAVMLKLRRGDLLAMELDARDTASPVAIAAAPWG